MYTVINIIIICKQIYYNVDISEDETYYKFMKIKLVSGGLIK